MPHQNYEPDSEEEFVQKVLPAFTRSQLSPDFRERVLARIEAASASRRRGFRWGGMPTLQQWIPALTVGLVLLAFMAWTQLPLGHQPVGRSPEQGNTDTRGSGFEGNIPQKAGKTLHELMERGRKQAEAGDTYEARVTFLEAVDQFAAPLNAFAWLAYEQGDPAEGLPRARLAVQLFPENATYQDTLATILCALDQHKEAVEVMEQAALLQPEKYRRKLERFHQGECM